MLFSELGLSEKVLAAVTSSGYTTPTPIQEQAIPHVLARRDVLGIAQTGTGKTAAFTLPMITMLEQGRARARMPRTLILEPTRELAAQVEENFIKYGVNNKLTVALIIGGVSFGDQDAKLMRGVDVLIATPGRLLDHQERGKLMLQGVELLVIDEADRMLDMGFIPDIERICKLVPFTRQTLFFTATMPPEITRISEQFLHNPVRIEVARPSSASATITQRLVATHSKDFEKRETLRRLIADAVDLKNAIIFCNRKSEVAVLHKSLVKYGLGAVALHGDMDQKSRTEALDSFRKGDMTILVASDVAARGLDIPDVSHVFNFDVPHHPEDYVHRIGRTGRAGRAGAAFTLVARSDEKYVAAIMKLTQQTIEWAGPELSGLAASEHTASDAEGRGSRGSSSRSSSSRSSSSRGESSRGERDSSGNGRNKDHDQDSAKSQGTRPQGTRPQEPDDKPREKLPRRDASDRNDAQPPRQNMARDASAVAGRETEKNKQNQPAPRPARQETQPRINDTKRQSSSSRAPVDHDDDVSVGMGDHMPAFMKRSVKSTT